MSSRKHTTEQIIRKLREAEVELAKGRSVLGDPRGPSGRDGIISRG